MKRPDYETATYEELLQWCAYQDAILEGPTDLQKMLAYTCSIIADDLELVLTTEKPDLKFLSGNKDDKIFERFTVLVKLRSDLSSLSLLPKDEEKPVKGKIAKIKPGDNAFEILMAEAREKNGNSKN